ncbi:MAG: hypothetical protein HY026_05880 [Deltaproteobacteria bacterium]|nr:hypothetical protein [Deltaproteobacteria bacterium]
MLRQPITNDVIMNRAIPMLLRQLCSGILVSFFISSALFAQEGKKDARIEASGEAAIIEGDLPSARLEAIARAKWDAIEKAVGVEISSQTIVRDAAVMDEVIKKKIGGSVRDFQVKAEGQKRDIYWVRISASVIPSSAKEAIAELARNTSITVFVPAKFPDGEVEESNAFVEGMINSMASQGYQVYDVASSEHTLTAGQVEQAMKSNNFLALRGLVYRYLSNVILIGKIDTAVTGEEGKDIGGGMKLPYNVVTARLAYRLIAGKGKGTRQIIASGFEQDKGAGATIKDAAYDAVNNLKEKVSQKIIDAVIKHLQENNKKVKILIENVADVNINISIKEILQGIVWTTGVQEEGLGEFSVEYPEQTVYLAVILSKKKGLKLVNFDDFNVKMRYIGF